LVISDVGVVDTPASGPCDLLPTGWSYRVEPGNEYMVDRICNARRVLGLVAQTDPLVADKIAHLNAKTLLGLP